MRSLFVLCLAVITFGVYSACADDADFSLQIYAVNIVQHPEQSWTGYGIYLGRGLILTAAHVVGQAARTRPTVRIAGLDLPAKAIREGAYEQVDLTLLSVDEESLPINVRMRRLPLCDKAPWVGQSVIVVVPEGIARSHVISPWLIPKDFRAKFSTAIGDVATTGNSGSGVFDAGQKCLLGIMSRKFQVRRPGRDQPEDIAKYFVPASTIGAFIPTEFRW